VFNDCRFYFFFFFFFQAEDGIRDFHVTGVQTCALPIFTHAFLGLVTVFLALDLGVFHREAHVVGMREAITWTVIWVVTALLFNRSEERRVGKECRSRCALEHKKKR